MGNTRRHGWALTTALLAVVAGGIAPLASTDQALSASASPTTVHTAVGHAGSVALVEVDSHRRHHRKHRRHHAPRPSSAHVVRTATSGTTARWAGSLDTGDRSAVDAAYAQSYASGTDVPTGWTGDNDACRAGTVTSTSQAATLRALNFVRSLSGLAPVSLSATLNARSQQTALMMSAQGALSHSPSSSWRCWTSTGAANAGRSNLALSYPSITSAGAIGMYMQEPGSGNAAVGHRRWLLNPFATAMGTGSTSTANAITVIGPTSSSRPDPAWVSWPSAGWFPSPLEPGGRWSLSAGNSAVSFAHATVHVWRNGTLLSTTRNQVEDGYAQPTLVFNVPTDVAGSGVFTVTVSGIQVAGSSASWSHTYRVAMFTPSS